ncbi:uncharacterized protein LOC142357642 [Convolutriloba macropyga]|uniref:uncharacterized protein LOC142357642 n=1 Tax=Convolutriloba macropyga TaxID=536237 RepID=UPI003F51DA94
MSPSVRELIVRQAKVTNQIDCKDDATIGSNICGQVKSREEPRTQTASHAIKSSPIDSQLTFREKVSNFNRESTKIPSIPFMEKPPENTKGLGINGYWYNIESFISKHPGGPVIEEFVGYDATDAYKSFHKSDVIKERHLRPIGYYNKKWFEFNKTMSSLHDDLVDEGFFKVNYWWYTMKILLTFIYIYLVFWIVINYGHSLMALSMAAILLAFFWQQNGFLMHDFMHTQVTHNRKIDEIFGVWFGTVCIGISASWWKDKHMFHHALTSLVDYTKDLFDPQMKSAFWAQCPKLFPYFQTKSGYNLIKIQHYTLIPVCMLLGRTAIIVDGFRRENRRSQWVALFVHVAWLLYLISLIPTWTGVFLFYSLAQTFQGVLHVQLLANHYSKGIFSIIATSSEGPGPKSNEFNFPEELIPDWYRRQVLTNINIANPVWLDFFHGGLNFHIEHHCFPRAPRNRLREISARVKKVCKEHDVFYDECGFVEIIRRTLVHLKQTGDIFALKDPR